MYEKEQFETHHAAFRARQIERGGQFRARLAALGLSEPDVAARVLGLTLRALQRNLTGKWAPSICTETVLRDLEAGRPSRAPTAKPPTPGQQLRADLDAAGLTITRLARAIQCHRSTVLAWVHNRRPLTGRDYAAVQYVIAQAKAQGKENP
jgi:hypothetical protein